jgi:hypothetical protein
LITRCPELEEFEGNDWSAIRRAFRSAPTWSFNQAWLKRRQRGFCGGEVRFGWRGDRLLYFAGLQDRNAHSTAKRRNDWLWALGDVVEIFAGAHRQAGYIEYHTAPNGLTLQLFWPDSAALRTVKARADLGRFVREDDAAVAKVRLEENGWLVYGEISSDALGVPGGKSLAGQVWDLSFGRYDYQYDGTSFVLSSTSPLRQPDFHRRREWRQICFTQSTVCAAARTLRNPDRNRE